MLAFAHDQLARYYLQTDHFAEAIPKFEDNVSVFQQLCDIDPVNVQFKRDLIVARQRLADTLLTQSRFEESLQVLNVALTEIDQLLQLSPTFTNRRLRVILLGRRREPGMTPGTWWRLRRVHRQVIAAAEQLLLEQPDDLQAMQDLAFAWDKLSVTHVGLGQLEEALAVLEKALPLRVQLLAAAPDRIRGTERVADNHVSIAKILAKLERHQEALERLVIAVDLLAASC